VLEGLGEPERVKDATNADAIVVNSPGCLKDTLVSDVKHACSKHRFEEC